MSLLFQISEMEENQTSHRFSALFPGKSNFCQTHTENKGAVYGKHVQWRNAREGFNLFPEQSDLKKETKIVNFWERLFGVCCSQALLQKFSGNEVRNLNSCSNLMNVNVW